MENTHARIMQPGFLIIIIINFGHFQRPATLVTFLKNFTLFNFIIRLLRTSDKVETLRHELIIIFFSNKHREEE